MNSLETLKQSLQSTLAESQANHEYNTEWLTSIQDGIYSCGLSVIALEQWIAIWKTAPLHQLDSDEVFYQEGVKFVSKIWDQINVVEVKNVC